jgi:hypothetical protein
VDNKDNNQKTDTSYGETNEEIPLQQPTGIDWQKTIGTIVRSKDNLDMAQSSKTIGLHTHLLLNMGTVKGLAFQRRPYIR